jgi:hypothetical protein
LDHERLLPQPRSELSAGGGRVARLVRREAAAYTSRRGGVAELGSRGGR